MMNSIKAAFIWGNAGIAQLVEQLICNQQVVGSNPTAGSLVNCRFCGVVDRCAWRFCDARPYFVLKKQE